jgi:hypothetical protein
MPSSADVLYQNLDYYAVLDADPDATFDELRIAFRRRPSSPDRSDASGSLATRRVAPQPGLVLRDPGRRRA